MALKASGSNDTQTQEASQWIPTLGLNGSANGQGPVASNVNPEGLAQNDFLLSRLAPFSGKPEDGENFLNSFVALSWLFSEDFQIYWFGIL